MDRFIKDLKLDLKNLKQNDIEEYYHVLTFLIMDALLLSIVTCLLISYPSLIFFILWAVTVFLGLYTGYLYFGARYEYIDVDKSLDRILKMFPAGILKWI